MVSRINLVTIVLLLGSSMLMISQATSAKDVEYSDSYSVGDSHHKPEKAESHETKRKWGSDRMGLWGKRMQMDDDVSSRKSQWNSGQMGMWGKRSPVEYKRKWDSRNMALWGRKRSAPIATIALKNGEYYDNYGNDDNGEGDDPPFLEKKGWKPGGMGVWGKRSDNAINQIRSQKSKWTSGDMGMWGKRFYDGEDTMAE